MTGKSEVSFPVADDSRTALVCEHQGFFCSGIWAQISSHKKASPPASCPASKLRKWPLDVSPVQYAPMNKLLTKTVLEEEKDDEKSPFCSRYRGHNRYGSRMGA